MPGWTLVVALILWAAVVVWAFIDLTRHPDPEEYRTTQGRRLRRRK